MDFEGGFQKKLEVGDPPTLENPGTSERHWECFRPKLFLTHPTPSDGGPFSIFEGKMKVQLQGSGLEPH